MPRAASPCNLSAVLRNGLTVNQICVIFGKMADSELKHLWVLESQLLLPLTHLSQYCRQMESRLIRTSLGGCTIEEPYNVIVYTIHFTHVFVLLLTISLPHTHIVREYVKSIVHETNYH